MQKCRVISILLISPPKVIYAKLFCVKETPHFFSKLISESPCILGRIMYNTLIKFNHDSNSLVTNSSLSGRL
jgi:dihydrofolate reductase